MKGIRGHSGVGDWTHRASELRALAACGGLGSVIPFPLYSPLFEVAQIVEDAATKLHVWRSAAA
jgi:hypothetical protein